MVLKSCSQEVKVKVPPSRLFKTLVTDSPEVLPKANPSIKSVEILEGTTIAPGCVYKTNFREGSPITYMKNRIEAVDCSNYSCKFTTFEGEILGDKVEKICHDLKLEASDDGGCVVKLKCEYHTKGGYEPTEEEINAGKAQAEGLYKACEDYLLANPTVCV